MHTHTVRHYAESVTYQVYIYVCIYTHTHIHTHMHTHTVAQTLNPKPETECVLQKSWHIHNFSNKVKVWKAEAKAEQKEQERLAR